MPGEAMTAHSARTLLADLAAKGLIEEGRQAELAAFAAGRMSGQDMPLYLRALVGLGAVITAFCFIGFLSAAGLIDLKSSAGLMLWGILFMAAALGLWLASRGGDYDIRHSFLLQTSFCLMGAGKTLAVLAVARQFEPDAEWGVTAGALLVTAATYHLYRLSIDRFLSVLAILVSLFANLISMRHAGAAQTVLLNAAFIAQLAAAAVLMTSGRIARDYVPVAYALIASLAVMVLFFATQSTLGYWTGRHEFSPAVMNASLTAALIALVAWAAGGAEKLRSEALQVACAGALGLGLISAPGVLLAIGLMVFGYARHDRLLLVSGGLLLPVFLFLYYYNLDMTLMAKSGVLTGSGALLLAGRAYMRYRRLDGEA